MGEQTLTLYIDLKDGEYADLEVVARASLAFSAALKEIAFLIDPSTKIQIDIESSTQGSLSLNSLIRFAKDKFSDPVTRRALLLALMFWFTKEVGSASIGLLVGEAVEDGQVLSNEEIEQIATKCIALSGKGAAKEHIQEIYRELEKDSSIIGVGITTKKGNRPKYVVPRREFLERMGGISQIESDVKRTKFDRRKLILVSPVLNESKNKWKFMLGQEKISASIEDEAFLQNLLKGVVIIPMKKGLSFDALIKTTEIEENGVWRIEGRSIDRVYSIEIDNPNLTLFPETNSPENND